MTRQSELLRAEINKLVGKEVVHKGSNSRFEVEYMSTGVLPFDILFGGGIPRGRYVELTGDYCVTPDTQVLTDALSWVPAGDLSIGYGLVGFDEQLNQGHGKSAKLKPSEIQLLGERKMRCVRVITDKGEITCSTNHGFVALHRTQNNREWRKARDLRVSDRMLWGAEPWKLLKDTRDAGYVAGILDGEGWLSDQRLSFGQLPGVVLDESILALKRLGFDVAVGIQGNGVMHARITGGRWETMRAIGQIRPHRFIARSPELWVGASMVSKGPNATPGSSYATVLAVEPIGLQDVVTMQTSSRTFFANGFPTHNSTLKSYLALNTIAQVQQSGGMAALIDTEHVYDKDWAVYLGVKDDDLLLVQPETGEEGIDTMELMIRNQVDFICLDSVAATLPQQEAGKRLSKEPVQPARLAALMSLAFRKLTAVNSRTGLLLINQLREQVGVTFGPTERAPGGRATGFYASMRVNCRKAGKVTRDVHTAGYDGTIKTKEQIGQTYRMTVEKSKLNRPWRELLFDWSLEYNEIDKGKFLMLQGLDLGLVQRKGTTTWLCNGASVQGKDNFLARVREDAEMQNFLEMEVRKHHGLFVPRGLSTPPKRTVAVAKSKLSKNSAPARTPARAQAKSSSTAIPKKKLSK